MTGIGSLNESSLHLALKEWYRVDGDLFEAPIGGFVVDLLRDGLLIEIQTRGFAAMRRKLDRLLDLHPMLIIYPVPCQKWILKLNHDGDQVSRNRSPKRGIAADVCQELVSFPSLLSHPNLTLEIALVEEEEVWRPDPAGWRRRGFVIEERRLVRVMETVLLSSPEDMLCFLPAGLPDPFTTSDIAERLGRSRHQAREIAYCLRESGSLVSAGRDRRGILYTRP